MERDTTEFIRERDIISDLSRELVSSTNDINAIHYFQKEHLGEFLKVVYPDGGYKWFKMTFSGLFHVKDETAIKALEAETHWEVF